LKSYNTIVEKLKGIEIQDTWYYYAAYIPFIGWLIPLFTREDNPDAQYHGKTGLILSVVCILSVLFLFLLNFITPIDWRIFRFILVVLIYCLYALYAGTLVAGIVSVYRNTKVQWDFLQKIIDIMPI